MTQDEFAESLRPLVGYGGDEGLDRETMLAVIEEQAAPSASATTGRSPRCTMRTISGTATRRSSILPAPCSSLWPTCRSFRRAIGSVSSSAG